MNKIIAIQGDLIIRKIDKLPKEVKPKEGKIVLYGEVTSHAHRFKDDANVSLYTIGDIQYVDVREATNLWHEEHNPIPIDLPGLYEIKRQREYQSKDMVRLVID